MKTANSISVNKQQESKAHLANIVSDNETAIAKLYDTYRSAFIYFIVKCAPAIEPVAPDIYQESFLVLYRNMKNGKLTKLNASVKTYLFTIGRNMALNYIRDNKYETCHNFPEPIFENDFPDDNENDYETMYKALSEIGEPCNSILRMYYMEDKSMKEIAEIMNYSTPQVAKNKKHSCMEKVKQYLRSIKYKRNI